MLQLHSMLCYKVTAEKTFEARANFPTFPKQSPKAYVDLATACMSKEASQRPTMYKVVGIITSMLRSVRSGDKLV